MNSPPTPAYIPPELEEKHRLRAAVRVPADLAVTARLAGDESAIRRRIAHALAERMAERAPLELATAPFDFGREVGFAAEIFVFTREELAAVLERHYIVMEPLPRYHERA